MATGLSPPIKELESQWASAWRPKSERQYFSKMNTIVRGVYNRSQRFNRLLLVVAEEMDFERADRSLYKLFLAISSAKKIR
jgi:hypothetical protein